jgi:uncharacterized protein YqeY
LNITGKIQEDMASAMKQRDRRRVTALRMLLSRLQLAAKESGGELSEEEELAVLKSERKKRSQAAEAFRRGGREDRAVAEESEMEMIEAYLPRGLSEEEIRAIVAEAVSETGAEDMSAMGQVMKAAMARIAGRADGKVVSEMVRSALTS